jgi:PHP family Zn ribbon phosphoesterase
MKKYIADLHIHTCLSSCAEIDMTPLRIIDQAIKKGIDIIAITDHNSAENVEIATNIANKRGIKLFPGMEVTSSEEAHVIALFDSVAKALSFQEIIYKNLPEGKNDEKRFGYQVVVNEKDEVLRFNERLLFIATKLNIKDLVDIVHSFGGLAIASHIDKEIFSIISQLGFIPSDINFDAIEISKNTNRSKAQNLFKEYLSMTWITSSDAHHLKDIGKSPTIFYLEDLSFDEIKNAMKGLRTIEW